MGDRSTTNILLAIIAGVLLFGSSAVTGVIQWIAIIGGALLLLYAVFAFAGYLVRESVQSLSNAKAHGHSELIGTVLGIVTMGFLPIVLGYAGLLWLDGVPKPFNVAAQSWIGMTWLGIIMAGAAALIISHLYTRRSDIIPAIRYGLSLFVRSPLAPLFLTMYGWRKARAAGDGVISSTATAALGLIFGLTVWAILAGIFLPLFGL
jgi:hypothetical protein